MFTTVRRAAVVAAVMAGVLGPAVGTAAAQEVVAQTVVGPFATKPECYEVRAKYEGRYNVSDCYRFDQGPYWFQYW